MVLTGLFFFCLILLPYRYSPYTGFVRKTCVRSCSLSRFSLSFAYTFSAFSLSAKTPNTLGPLPLIIA